MKKMNLENFLERKEVSEFWIQEEEIEEFLRLYHNELKEYFNTTYRRKFCLDCFSFIKSGKASSEAHKNSLMCKTIFGLTRKSQKYLKSFKSKFLELNKEELIKKGYLEIEENGKIKMKLPFINNNSKACGEEEDKMEIEEISPEEFTSNSNQNGSYINTLKSITDHEDSSGLESFQNSSSKSNQKETSSPRKPAPIDIFARSKIRYESRSRSQSNQESNNNSNQIQKQRGFIKLEDLNLDQLSNKNISVKESKNLESPLIERNITAIIPSRTSLSSQRIRISPGFRSHRKNQNNEESSVKKIKREVIEEKEITKFYSPEEVARMINFSKGDINEESLKQENSSLNSKKTGKNLRDSWTQTSPISINKRREIALSPIKTKNEGDNKFKRKDELGYRSILALYEEVKNSKTSIDKVSKNVEDLTKQIEGIKDSLLEYLTSKRKRLKTQQLANTVSYKKSSKIKSLYHASKMKLEDMKKNKIVRN